MAKRRKRKVSLGSDRATHIEKMQQRIAMARRGFESAKTARSCGGKLNYLINAARNMAAAEVHSYAQGAGASGLRPKQGKKNTRRIHAVGNIANQIDDAIDAALEKCVR
jgi:hypothetical protein